MICPRAYDPPLRIALVTETWPPEINGVAMTLSRLVDGLAARGHHIQVVRPRQETDGAGDPASEDPRVQHLLRPGMAIPRYQGLRLGFPSAGVLAAAWRRWRPDVVHVATEGPLGGSALRAARGLDLPTTSSFHTNFDDYAGHYALGCLRPLVTSYLRRFHNRTALTMAPSPDLIRRLDAAGYRNLALFPRGVDTARFSPALRDDALRRQWGCGDGDLVLLHVGRVAPEKNLPLAIRAWETLRATRPEVRLVVAGDGPLRTGLAAAHPEVRFLGAVPAADLGRVYASADLFLFPSLSETFGNVLLEAMASGLPAVAYDYAAARTHLISGENGLSAPCADEAAWLRQAMVLAANPALRGRLGATARRTAEGISWETVIDRFAGLLHGAIERHDEPRRVA